MFGSHQCSIEHFLEASFLACIGKLYDLACNGYNKKIKHLQYSIFSVEATQQTFVLMKTSWRRLWSSSSEDVFKTSTRHLQDVLKTSSRRLQDIFKTSSRLLQDVFKTSSRRLQDFFKTSSRHLQDLFKTYSRCFENVFKTSSRHLQDVFKTYYQVKLFLVT